MASLDQILFFDAAGNPLSNITYTLVSTSVPEPSALALLSVGLMFVVVARMLRAKTPNPQAPRGT
jgi:hypothetical protein